GGEAAVLFRLLLLSQLASSLPAFRASLARYEAFLELGAAAAVQGRALGRRDFRQLFPAGSDDLQLAFFPLVLPPGSGAATERDRDVVRRLRAFAASSDDPKAGALARLLDGRVGKTIVFVQSRATRASGPSRFFRHCRSPRRWQWSVVWWRSDGRSPEPAPGRAGSIGVIGCTISRPARDRPRRPGPARRSPQPSARSYSSYG